MGLRRPLCNKEKAQLERGKGRSEETKKKGRVAKQVATVMIAIRRITSAAQTFVMGHTPSSPFHTAPPHTLFIGQ